MEKASVPAAKDFYNSWQGAFQVQSVEEAMKMLGQERLFS